MALRGDASGEISRPTTSRREAELRHMLVEAIYHDRVRDAAWRAHQLQLVLGARADSDPDLEIAHHWLEEQADRDDERRVVSRRTWRRNGLKLFLTGLPLVLAALLTLLLAAVLIWD